MEAKLFGLWSETPIKVIDAEYDAADIPFEGRYLRDK